MIDPRHIDVITWCDFTVQSLAPLGPAPRLESPDKWKAWAEAIYQLPQLASYVPPDPRDFDDWRKWAYHFIQAVPL